MTIVNFLAELWGFSIVIICFALLIKPKNIECLLALVEDSATLFLLGLINVILGVALVLSYNVWELNWEVIITIVGWLVLLRGVIILFFPEFIHAVVAKVKTQYLNILPMVLVVGVLLGCALVYLGLTM